MRRKDREMDRDFALSVADKCEYAFLSIVDPDGKPYGVALTVVRHENYMYFHCAQEGFKIDCFKSNPDACMVCVGDTERQSDKFTTKYESAVIRGRLSEVTEDGEKIFALKILCERHTPANMASFDKAVKASLKRTAIWKMSIDEITGKRKK